MKKYKADWHIESETIPIYEVPGVYNFKDVITKLEEIIIHFDYPLSSPVDLKFIHLCGFTRKDFYNAVRKGYKKIYKKEDNPGRVPGLLNRAKCEGPYGIWGHDLCDLYLEGFTEKKPGYFILSVGS